MSLFLFFTFVWSSDEESSSLDDSLLEEDEELDELLELLDELLELDELEPSLFSSASASSFILDSSSAPSPLRFFLDAFFANLSLYLGL